MPAHGVCMPRQSPPKVHIHGQSPNVTVDTRSTVIEALCERYNLQPVVVPPGCTGPGQRPATRRRFSATTASGSWGSEATYCWAHSSESLEFHIQ